MAAVPTRPQERRFDAMENPPGKNRWEWLYRLVALDSARHWFVGGGAILAAIITFVTGWMDHQTRSGIFALTLFAAASFLVLAWMMLLFADRFRRPRVSAPAPSTADQRLISTANPDGSPADRFLVDEHKRLQGEATRLSGEVQQWREWSEALEAEHAQLQRLHKLGEDSHAKWVELYDESTAFREEIRVLWQRASETISTVDAILGGYHQDWSKGGLSLTDLYKQADQAPDEKIARAREAIAEYNRQRAAEILPSVGTGVLADALRAIAGNPLVAQLPGISVIGPAPEPYDPCYCGSGKHLRECHGAPTAE